jgi:hypothetical protein
MSTEVLRHGRLMEHRRPRHAQFLPMILDQPPPLLGVAMRLADVEVV